MKNTIVITIEIPIPILEDIDKAIKKGFAKNRDKFIEYACRNMLKKAEKMGFKL